MGKKNSPTPPPAPDPMKMAAAQTGSNINTASASAALNAVNQTSPFGTVNYDQTGSMNIGGNEVPRWTQTTTLSPQEQSLYDKENSVTQQAYDTAGQAMGQAQQTLATPFSLNNLPPLQTGVNQGRYASSFGAVAPRLGAPGAGPVQSGVGTPGPMQKDIPLQGQQTSFATPGGMQKAVANTAVPKPGAMWGAAQPTGQQTGFANAGPIQQQIGANDFSADRQRVEDATMARFDQDIGRREQSTISRLNAQGLQQGTEAYGTEMDLLNRSRNDARTQAILAGGQEQSRLFGLEQQQGQFANNAQGQEFGQNLAGGEFTNQALSNLYGQRQASVGQQNAQQGQLFGQQMQGAGQLFGQNLSAGNFANQAQQQAYGQALGSAGFGNQARSTINDTNLAAMNARNAAQGQEYGQLLSSGQFANQAQGQQFNQGMASTDLYNQAAAQATGQNQAQAAFGNTAGQQEFDNSMRNAAFGNQARQQSISEQQLQRSQPINEVAALLGLGSGVQAPNGAPSFNANVGGTDVMGAYGMQQAALQNAFNQKMQQQNAMWGSLGQLGGALGGAAIMSDVRTKNIIRRIGQTDSGIPIYLFTYKSGGPPQVGVIAQEAREIRPGAVHDIDGILHVDYLKVA